MAYRQGECQQVILPKAEIDASQLPETVKQQSRAGKKRQRQSKFHHNQTSAQSVAARLGRGAPALFQRVMQINMRALPGRSAATEHAGQAGSGQGENQHGYVDADIRFGRYRKRGEESQNHLKHDGSKRYSQDTPDESQCE